MARNPDSGRRLAGLLGTPVGRPFAATPVDRVEHAAEPPTVPLPIPAFADIGARYERPGFGLSGAGSAWPGGADAAGPGDPDRLDPGRWAEQDRRALDPPDPGRTGSGPIALRRTGRAWNEINRADGTWTGPERSALTDMDRAGFDPHGRDPQGYASDGLDPQGYASDGRDPQGCASDSRDPDGFGPDGFDPAMLDLDALAPAVLDPAVLDHAGRGGTGRVRRSLLRRRAGSAVRRWVPDAGRGVRLDPGRPGAIALALVTALAAVIAAVGVWLGRPQADPVPTTPVVGLAPLVAGTTAASAEPAGPIVVSVTGKVARPGLVQVPDGARVADAIEAAGGALPGTDLAALNMARRVADGEQVAVGVPAPADSEPAGSGEPAAAVASGGGKVDLNRATVEQLDGLPGVGPVTAQRILAWRTSHGRFSRVDQLREIEGIGERRFGQLRDLVTLG